MSDQAIDLQEQIARINRTNAETAKLIEEARKFAAEQHKLAAGPLKLAAETRYFDRHVWQLVAGSITAGAALVGATAAIVKLFFFSNQGAACWPRVHSSTVLPN